MTPPDRTDERTIPVKKYLRYGEALPDRRKYSRKREQVFRDKNCSTMLQN